MSALFRGRGRRFAKECLVTWVAVAGLLTTVAALLPAIQLTWQRSLVALGGSLVVAASYAWRRSRPVHLSIEEFTTDPGHCKFTIQCPCHRELALQSHRIAAGAYGAQPPIAAERYEQWRLRNNRILVCLVDGTQRVVAYFDVLPLRKEFFEDIKAGTVSEVDIRYEHILDPKQIRKGSRLYLAGIAADSPETIRGKRTAAITIWSILKYFERFYLATAPHPLIAIGATPEGERLLEYFGFRLVMTGEQRKDKKPLYEHIFDRAFLDKALSKVPEWTHSVCLSWKAGKGTM